MIVSQQTRIQVMDVLDRLIVAASRNDTDTVMALLAPDFTAFAREMTEPVLDRNRLRERLEQGYADLPGSLSDPRIMAEGTIAWVTAECAPASRDHRSARSGKFSAVLRGTGHTWEFVHIHVSNPE